MNENQNVHKIKCKSCNVILSDDVRAFQKCDCGKVKFDTDRAEEYTRIIGNQEDYEIIE